MRVVLLEGVFDQDLSVDGRSVAEALSQFVGTRIRLAAHHLPADPVDPTRWGGGSCMYQPGPCLYGHHVDPTRMFSYVGDGVLGRDREWWTVTRFDGGVDRPDLSVLAGHQGRVAIATVFDVEAMRDAVSSTFDGVDLGVRAEELRSVLERLRRK